MARINSTAEPSGWPAALSVANGGQVFSIITRQVVGSAAMSRLHAARPRQAQSAKVVVRGRIMCVPLREMIGRHKSIFCFPAVEAAGTASAREKRIMLLLLLQGGQRAVAAAQHGVGRQFHDLLPV